jgi:hypothetical protein
MSLKQLTAGSETSGEHQRHAEMMTDTDWKAVTTGCERIPAACMIPGHTQTEIE